ncbi:hypothetical protein HYS31_07570 [Candidatus Woesearchaeota archaeon]|nr:hypothetical protein [Candidatus Woesearchaeota archaeon]
MKAASISEITNYPIFRGSTSARINKDRSLFVPNTFHIPDSVYVLREDKTDGYKHLSFVPEGLWNIAYDILSQAGRNTLAASSYDLERAHTRRGNPRFILPEYALLYLGIKEPFTVVIIGNLRRFELWRPEDNNNRNAGSGITTDDLEELAKLGF